MAGCLHIDIGGHRSREAHNLGQLFWGLSFGTAHETADGERVRTMWFQVHVWPVAGWLNPKLKFWRRRAIV